MLARYELPLKTNGSNSINQFWGSLLHGALMQYLPPDIATDLHSEGLKPFSQFIKKDANGQCFWVFCCLTDKMSIIFEDNIVKKMPDKWHIKQKNQDLEIGQPVSVEKISYQQLTDRVFKSAELDRSFKLEISSPTTFKSNGKHVIFPTSSLIINSLMQRWDAFSKDYGISDPEVREHLTNYVHIRDYRLSSASYSIDSAWLKGFYGNIVFSISGPDALRRLALLLLNFSRFSGIGVKTSLGMGGLDHGK